MRLNELDCVVAEQSLLRYLAFFQSSIPQLRAATSDDIMRDLTSAGSARRKLTVPLAAGTFQLDWNELKVLYVALDLFAQDAEQYLQRNDPSDPVPAPVFEADRIGRNLRWTLNETFAENGIDIDRFLGFV